MQNEPIISNSSATNSKSTKKQLNFKIIGITIGTIAIIAVMLILVLPKILPGDSIDFNENANANNDLITKDEYVTLENYDLTSSELSSFNYADIQERIILFFTNAYPEISTLTVTKHDIKEEEISEEGEETPILKKTEELSIKSDTNKEFAVNINIFSNLENYTLEILSNGKAIYDYVGNSITKNAIPDKETDKLVEATIAKLPHSGKKDDIEYEITYEGANEDKLTVSSSNCKEAISLAVEWANNFAENLNREVTENDFVCESE